MRRLLLLAFVALAPMAVHPAHSRDLYYRTMGGSTFGTIYAVNENGGTPRVVLDRSEYAYGLTATMTRFNHVGSNGQAVLQGKPGHSDLTEADIQLIYRAPNGQVVVKAVTNLAGQELSPYQRPVLGQDDSFFSFRAQDGVGRSTIWRLNVTVDQALDPAYVPPTSYSDPRLQLLVDDTTNGADIHDHTWSPDGNRMAYLDEWTDASGGKWVSVRLKNIADGTVDPLTHPSIVDATRETVRWQAWLQWSPVSDEIIDGGDNGIWACYADSPGVTTWIARPITTKTKTQTIEELLSYPFWRPDGGRIATNYVKRTTTTKTGVITDERLPGVMTPNGWPVQKLLRTGDPGALYQAIGWTP